MASFVALVDSRHLPGISQRGRRLKWRDGVLDPSTVAGVELRAFMEAKRKPITYLSNPAIMVPRDGNLFDVAQICLEQAYNLWSASGVDLLSYEDLEEINRGDLLLDEDVEEGERSGPDLGPQ